MDLRININNKCILAKYKEGVPPCCPENPSWMIDLHTPTISFQLNEEEEYSCNVYNLTINISSNLELTYSDKGLFWRIKLILFGFGFNISRQACY